MIGKSMSKIFSLIFFNFLPLMYSNSLAPALYVFGDSLFDSGNNNFLPTLTRVNYPPYGIDFPDGSTGRFTNGRTVPDFIAEFLKLPYPPPFMSVYGQTMTGLNYASGSCGILPETGRSLGLCFNLGTQVNLFEYSVKISLTKQLGNSSKLSQHLSKSIFLVSIGTNDYSNMIEGSYSILNSTNLNLNNSQQIAQFLLDKLFQNFERLYNLGARKIVMFEIGPLGCTPAMTKTHNHTGPCFEEANLLITDFNKLLPQTLQNLTHSLPGSIFVLGRCNWLGYDAIINPSKYGLKDTSDPCCATWLNGTSICIPFQVPTSNSSQTYFWDAYHLTETIYSTIASRCINDTNVCLPTLTTLINM